MIKQVVGDILSFLWAIYPAPQAQRHDKSIFALALQILAVSPSPVASSQAVDAQPVLTVSIEDCRSRRGLVKEATDNTVLVPA